MKNRFNYFLLMDQAGEGGDGGGGDLLSGAQGGGGAAGGDAGSGGSSGQGGASSEGTGNPPGAGGGAPSDWQSSLPPELQENQQLRRYKSVADLAAGYANLQRQFSSDKLVVPGKNATEDDWKQVYEKLGVPKDVKDYAVKFQDGVTVAPEFVDEFKALAHANGILPRQAQKLADWFSEKNKGAEAQLQNEIKAQREKELGDLKKEWGDAFSKKVSLANALFSEAPPEIQAAFKESGLVANTSVVKFLAGIAEKYIAEDRIRNIESGGNGQFSPTEAKSEIDKILGNSSHPYYIKEHPGHREAVQEVQKLFSMIK